MAYGLRYHFEFRDALNSLWRVELLLKDYGDTSTLLNYAADNPLIIQTTANNEDKDASLFGTKATFTYIVDGTPNGPHPNTFMDIDEDSYRMQVYQDGILQFRGVLKPDGSRYVLEPTPYEFSINATDYLNMAKAEVVDLNTTDPEPQFLYGYITLIDLFFRTIYKILPVEETVLIKFVSNLQPDVVEDDADNYFLSRLWVHTDIFYNVDDGPDKIYDAIEKLWASLGMRFFYSNGAYWIQRIQDIGKDIMHVQEWSTLGSVLIRYNEPNNIFILDTDGTYSDNKPEIGMDAGIKSQKNTYKLKSINKIQNFQWNGVVPGVGSGGSIPNWLGPNAESGMGIASDGAGTAEDPHRLLVYGEGATPDIDNVRQPLLPGIYKNMYIRLSFKIEAFYTIGQRFSVLLSAPEGFEGLWSLDSGGNWTDITTDSGGRMFIEVNKTKSTRTGTLEMTSNVVPNNYDFYQLTIYVHGPVGDPEDLPPSGETPTNVVYPILLGIFSNNVESQETLITNNSKYSWIPEDKEKTFIDMADGALSNCLFYFNGSTHVPVPRGNWVNNYEPSNLFNEEDIVHNSYVNASGDIVIGAPAEDWDMIRVTVQAGTTYTFGRINISGAGYSAFYGPGGLVLNNGIFPSGSTVTLTAPIGATTLVIDIKRPEDTSDVYAQGTVNIGTMLITPFREFTGPQSLEQITSRLMLDQYQIAPRTIEGEIYSNKLYFYQSLEVIALNKRFIMMSDDYNIKSCTHNISAKEYKLDNTGKGVYTSIAINK